MSPLDDNIFFKHPVHQYRLIRYRTYIHIDRLRGLDLTKAVTVEELKLNAHDSRMYYASSPSIISVLRKLKIQPEDSIVDIGCGKGRAMYYMHKFPFKSIGGVEISPSLTSICINNFKKLNYTNCFVYNVDACQFKEYDSYNYIYFYNPFSGQILEQCMKNIQESLLRNPRKIKIIYHNPVYDSVVQDHSFHLVKKYHFDRFYIYENEINKVEVKP